MTTPPRLSLCIMTHNRADLLPVALGSALREASAAAPGLLEVLVSDNASSDATPAVLAGFRERFPALRTLRLEENLGFDGNYLHCMEQARGEFIWILGDDDAFMPGAAATMLRVLEADPDAVLCPALECDRDLNPLEVRTWFEDPEETREVWRLATHEDLAAYFDALRFQAGAFAFISVGVIRRERFLAGLETFREVGMGYNYIHLWGMLCFLLAPAVLYCLREPLVLNRTGNDTITDPWRRGMVDLRAWAAAGEHFLGKEPRLRSAFNGVLRRNHQDIMVRRMRMGAAENAEKWGEARELLMEVGFDPLWVDAADFLYRFYLLEVPLSPLLRAPGFCLADVSLVALGARKAVVLAPGGLASLVEVSGLLDALRVSGRFERILVVCDPGGAGVLEGFEVLEADPLAFAGDRAFQKSVLARLAAFRPGLLVNSDRSRGLAGDLMAARAQAPASLAYHGRAPGIPDDLYRVLDRSYAMHLNPDGPGGAMESALGLPVGKAGLWPTGPSREEAGSILDGAGWDPARTLVLCGDAPETLAQADLPTTLARHVASGGTVAGVGGRGSFRCLDPILEPLGDRAMNLGEGLAPGTMAALMERCKAHLGGGAAAILARCMGCRPLSPL